MLPTLIVLGALLVLPNLIGIFLPERYVGRAQGYFDRPRAEVWDALEDHMRHPMTGKMRKETEDLPDENGLPVWAETMAGNERVVVRTTRSERPSKLVREMASAVMPMTSRWEYSLESQKDGCLLTLEGETFIRRGTWMVPLFRFMMVVGGGVKKGFVIQMRMLGDTLGTPAKIAR